MARNQHLIDDLLDNTEEQIDKSLRGKAMQRATAEAAPRTLTAWEWEEYYEKYGKPGSHTSAHSRQPSVFLERWRTWWRARR